MAYLEIQNLRIEYERGIPTLDNYNLTVNEGELLALLGPSGCGKTTTLRSVAGFIEPAAGKITIAGKDNTRLPPNKRDIGMVFQSYALFPHLSVFNNVAFGLKMRGVSKSEVKTRVHDALRLVDLTGFEERRPAQLSGGQRQRVALARSIVIEPTLLLFDEPLSNLDAKLRLSMRAEIRRLQQRLGITALYVTHDQIEAMAISDRIVVMNLGEIEQVGTPEEIFSQPATGFVADFMGFANKFTATITKANDSTLDLRAGDHQITIPNHRNQHEGQTVEVYFRPEGAQLIMEPAKNSVPGEVILRTFQGTVVEYIVSTSLGEFVIHQNDETTRYEPGQVYILFNTDKLIPISEKK